MSGNVSLPAAIHVARPAVAGPVVVSVPHAGRTYPPALLAEARVERVQLERLEDAWCDLLAGGACAAGATVVRAMWARAVADCNRGESQMAPGEVAGALRLQFSAPGRKERAGLGVIPTRLAGCGPLWKRPIDCPALEWRLQSLHRPYHRALAQALATARAQFGRAILFDLHSMPPIPPGQPGYGAQIVIGDRHGTTAGEGLIEATVEAAEALGVAVARNQPYAGGHIVRAHGAPGRDIHAVQIEIDRSLYLTADGAADPARVAALARWFDALVRRAAHIPLADIPPLAAE